MPYFLFVSFGTRHLRMDNYTGVYGAPYPTETMIAQTWNKELAYEVGEAIGQEYADTHIYGWHGPAMNMRRTAFNGRNFEYYSEDGVLAAEVNAAATEGVYAYIKHFAGNDLMLGFGRNARTDIETPDSPYLVREIIRDERLKNEIFRNFKTEFPG